MSVLLLETEETTETEKTDEESELELYSYYCEFDYDDAAA